MRRVLAEPAPRIQPGSSRSENKASFGAGDRLAKLSAAPMARGMLSRFPLERKAPKERRTCRIPFSESERGRSSARRRQGGFVS